MAKSKLKQYKCIKHYYSLVSFTPTGSPVYSKAPDIEKDDIMTQMGKGDERFLSKDRENYALYESTLQHFSDCFELVK